MWDKELEIFSHKITTVKVKSIEEFESLIESFAFFIDTLLEIQKLFKERCEKEFC